MVLSTRGVHTFGGRIEKTPISSVSSTFYSQLGNASLQKLPSAVHTYFFAFLSFHISVDSVASVFNQFHFSIYLPLAQNNHLQNRL